MAKRMCVSNTKETGADATPMCAVLREVIEQGLLVLREGATIPQLENWAALAQAALDETAGRQ